MDNGLILPIFGIHPVNAAKWVEKLPELEWAFDQSPLYGEIGLDSDLPKMTTNGELRQGASLLLNLDGHA